MEKKSNQINQEKQDLTVSKDITNLMSSSILSTSIALPGNSFRKIKNIFEEGIKPLRIKFDEKLYEKNAREIRNLIIKLRKEYYQPQSGFQTSNQSITNTQAQTSTQKI